MDLASYDRWTAVLWPDVLAVARQGERIPADTVLQEGTVVILALRGRPRAIGLRGTAVVRSGMLVPVGEAEAVDIIDPARASERRYLRAVRRAGLPERETGHVCQPGHDWEAGCASPVDDEGLAHVYCARVQGRHVWTRAVTYVEAVALGITK